MIWFVLKLLIACGCGALFSWGGYSWLAARRFFMPAVLASAEFGFTHDWWALTALLAMAAFSLGYSQKSPLGHSLGDAWGRGVWGLLGAYSLSVGVLASGHAYWYFVLPYWGLNFTLENALKRVQQVTGDFFIGLGFSSILFIIH